jgi:hypothetical protein
VILIVVKHPVRGDTPMTGPTSLRSSRLPQRQNRATFRSNGTEAPRTQTNGYSSRCFAMVRLEGTT